jgi:hypothetical protein
MGPNVPADADPFTNAEEVKAAKPVPAVARTATAISPTVMAFVERIFASSGKR